MTRLPLTPSQTVGPFFHDALLRTDMRRNVVAPADAVGERIRITGSVYDGDRAPVPDALIEIWQADHQGRYSQSVDGENTRASFTGFGRAGTDENGAYWFETVRPGRVSGANGSVQACHISFAVFARGLLNHLYTRLYFADDPSHATDAVLSNVPAARRHTLVARSIERTPMPVYRFDVVLQGADETVFFDFRS